MALSPRARAGVKPTRRNFPRRPPLSPQAAWRLPQRRPPVRSLERGATLSPPHPLPWLLPRAGTPPGLAGNMFRCGGLTCSIYAVIFNDVLGTKFKLVTGYVGSQETILAIERGEAHGRCVFSLSALKIARPDWLRDRKINVLVLTALEKSAEFSGVPAVVDLVTKQEDRQLLELMVGPSAMARPFVAPPGVSADKAALLRRAFDATMQDGEFRAEAARMQADLAPTTGEYVQKLVARIYATPRPVVERVKKLLTAG
jgi:hypothetical protein